MSRVNPSKFTLALGFVPQPSLPYYCTVNLGCGLPSGHPPCDLRVVDVGRWVTVRRVRATPLYLLRFSPPRPSGSATPTPVRPCCRKRKGLGSSSSVMNGIRSGTDRTPRPSPGHIQGPVLCVRDSLIDRASWYAMPRFGPSGFLGCPGLAVSGERPRGPARRRPSGGTPAITIDVQRGLRP